ncbi:hypothetical protein [Phycicoccus flavus]|uniref:hypothetical protein n=1 Tax=Phycicoccus flavus TaxID=2502783 RepID=UPI000FEB9EC9|nr:hypothetical protein [Phycicoccus flavus]NHA69080.1 hypothetical protein [Phycicoccus flavus]
MPHPITLGAAIEDHLSLRRLHLAASTWEAEARTLRGLVRHVGDIHGESALAFLGMSLLTACYAWLFLQGTLEVSGVLGPQVLYLGLLTIYLVHALYSGLEWVERRAS